MTICLSVKIRIVRSSEIRTTGGLCRLCSGVIDFWSTFPSLETSENVPSGCVTLWTMIGPASIFATAAGGKENDDDEESNLAASVEK